jgi:hypothetical protein
MASSGSVDFSVNRDEIIRDAMFEIGALGDSETPTDADIQLYSRYLNRLVKQWQGTADFAPGLKMWSRKRATLYMQDSTNTYSLGPSGDNWAVSPVETTLSVTANSGAGTITVTSATGITSGMYIGIRLDSNTIHWTTVNGAPSGSTVTLTAIITGVASSGKSVYAYTSKGRRPLQFISLLLSNSRNNEIPLIGITAKDYESITRKVNVGQPQNYYYESQLTNGTLYLDCYPVDTSWRLKGVYLSPIEDFDAATDTPDFPQQWYRPLHYGLAVDIYGTARQGEPTKRLIGLRDESIAMARNQDAEVFNEYFQPGIWW